MCNMKHMRKSLSNVEKTGELGLVTLPPEPKGGGTKYIARFPGCNTGNVVTYSRGVLGRG